VEENSERVQDELPARKTTTNKLAIASLVLGVLGLLAWLVAGGIGTALIGLAAAITGVTASNQVTRSSSEQTGQKLAVAGLVLGLVGVIAGILLMIISGTPLGFSIFLW